MPGKTVTYAQIDRIKMSVAPPKEVEEAGMKVIHEGRVKCWVGIGWVDEGSATEDDLKKIPTVI